MKTCTRCKKERFWHRAGGVAMLKHSASQDYACDDGRLPVAFEAYEDPNLKELQA